jgi:hypothetical protein
MKTMNHGFTTTSSIRIGLMVSENNTYHSMRSSSVKLSPIHSDGINNGFWRKMATTMMKQRVPKKVVSKYLRQSGLSGKAKPKLRHKSARIRFANHCRGASRAW